MKRVHAILLVGLVFTGCFRTPESLPSIPIEQNQFIPTTPEICSNVDGAFDRFIFSGYPEADSIQWYQVYNGDSSYLETGNPIEVPVNPNNRRFFCYQFYPNGDTIVSETHLYTCFRGFYVPNSFRPDQNGLNDCLQILYSLPHNPTTNVYWKVITTDGVTVFETGSLDECWDGEFNGHTVPSGSYLLYIDLEFESGEDYTYTGILTIVE